MTAYSHLDWDSESAIFIHYVLFRYQTITFENLGYSGANVDVRPYGIAKYPFVAEFDNELSLNEGDMLFLNRYVDKEWLEAEFDSTRK